VRIASYNIIEMPMIVESERQDVVSSQELSEFPIYNGRGAVNADVVGSVFVKDSAKGSPTG
jgi:hypothetical protein